MSNNQDDTEKALSKLEQAEKEPRGKIIEDIETGQIVPVQPFREQKKQVKDILNG